MQCDVTQGRETSKGSKWCENSMKSHMIGAMEVVKAELQSKGMQVD